MHVVLFLNDEIVWDEVVLDGRVDLNDVSTLALNIQVDHVDVVSDFWKTTTFGNYVTRAGFSQSSHFFVRITQDTSIRRQPCKYLLRGRKCQSSVRFSWFVIRRFPATFSIFFKFCWQHLILNVFNISSTTSVKRWLRNRFNIRACAAIT